MKTIITFCLIAITRIKDANNFRLLEGDINIEKSLKPSKIIQMIDQQQKGNINLNNDQFTILPPKTSDVISKNFIDADDKEENKEERKEEEQYNKEKQKEIEKEESQVEIVEDNGSKGENAIMEKREKDLDAIELRGSQIFKPGDVKEEEHKLIKSTLLDTSENVEDKKEKDDVKEVVKENDKKQTKKLKGGNIKNKSVTTSKQEVKKTEEFENKSVIEILKEKNLGVNKVSKSPKSKKQTKNKESNK
jgi:hypothetical protein